MVYRVVTHFTLKKNLDQALMKELATARMQFFSHEGVDIEILHNEHDLTYIKAITTWQNIDEARKFKEKHHKKVEDFTKKYCKKMPTVEVLKIIAV